MPTTLTDKMNSLDPAGREEIERIAMILAEVDAFMDLFNAAMEEQDLIVSLVLQQKEEEE